MHVSAYQSPPGIYVTDAAVLYRLMRNMSSPAVTKYVTKYLCMYLCMYVRAYLGEVDATAHPQQSAAVIAGKHRGGCAFG